MANLNGKKERSSNLELCRIVCMLMIIAHHCVVHGGAIGMDVCTNKYIALFLLPGGKLCFDAFLAMSAWFMVDQTFKTERFLKTWLQVFFYSVLFFFVAKAFGSELGKRQLLSTLLPITGNSHGFAAAYLAFYLLLPFLRMVSDHLNQNQAKWLVIVLVYFQVINQLIGRFNGYYQVLYSELTLFVMCYFIAFYLKKYPLKITQNKFVMLAVAGMTWLVVFLIWCLVAIYRPGDPTVGFLFGLCQDESSVLFLIGGYALFFFFNNLRIPTSRLINTVAHTTFGILLIHDHNFFRYPLWKTIFKAESWFYSEKFLLYVGFCTVSLFLICGLVDFVRQKTLERLIFSSYYVVNTCRKLDRKLFGDTQPEKTVVVPENNPLQKPYSGPLNAYLFITLFSTVLFWMWMIISHSAQIDTYFVTDHTNTAMDYFNMLANIWHQDPYFEKANYPAMCFLILKVLYHAEPVGQPDGFLLRNDMVAQLFYILVILACVLAIWELIQYMAGGNKTVKNLFSVSLIFSGPFIFTLERGNLLILALVGSLAFLAFYNDRDQMKRLFAYFMLAFAASIKVYPAVLGLLVLKKRRFKEAVLLMGMGMLMFILPFFVFDGLASISKMIEGFTAAADVQLGMGFGINYCFDNLLKIIGATFGVVITQTPGWMTILAACFCFLLFFTSKQEWKQLYALVMVMIWVPSFSYTYALTFMFLPIVSFFFRTSEQRWKYAYATLMALLIIPYFLPMANRFNDILNLGWVKYPLSWGTIVINASLVLITVMIFLDNCISFFQSFGRPRGRFEGANARNR